MAKETQKAKIDRLEKELWEYKVLNHKLNTEFNDKASEKFEKSSIFRDMNRQIEELEEINKELSRRLDVQKHFEDKENIDKVMIRATNQGIKISELEKEIEVLTKKLNTAQRLNDKNEIGLISIRATQRGVKIEKLESEIQKLKNEKGNIKSHNERGAGRKNRFTDSEKENMRMYRAKGNSYKSLGEMFNCSVGTVHKIINENLK
ncbi:MAG: hypothetical protein RSG48_06085 [Clostridia bacterium]